MMEVCQSLRSYSFVSITTSPYFNGINQSPPCWPFLAVYNRIQARSQSFASSGIVMLSPSSSRTISTTRLLKKANTSWSSGIAEKRNDPSLTYWKSIATGASPPPPSTVKTLLKLPNPLGTVTSFEGSNTSSPFTTSLYAYSPGASTNGASQAFPFHSKKVASLFQALNTPLTFTSSPSKPEILKVMARLAPLKKGTSMLELGPVRCATLSSCSRVPVTVGPKNRSIPAGNSHSPLR